MPKDNKMKLKLSVSGIPPLAELFKFSLTLKLNVCMEISREIAFQLTKLYDRVILAP